MMDSTMKIKFLLIIILFALTTVLAGQKPDFSGVWVLDPNRSFNNGPGFEQTMTISNENGRIILEAKQKTPRGEVTINEEYLLDGNAVDFKPMGVPPNTTAKRKSWWMPNDRGILIEDEFFAEGKAIRQVTRKWQLSADRQTLTVDIYIDDQRGSFEIKRIYHRH